MQGHQSSKASLLTQCQGNENKDMFSCEILFFSVLFIVCWYKDMAITCWHWIDEAVTAGLNCAAAGYGNVNQMNLIRMASGPRDRSLPMKRVLKHLVIAFSVCTSWLWELFIDGVILHYSANVTFQARGEDIGGNRDKGTHLKSWEVIKTEWETRGKKLPMKIIHVLVGHATCLYSTVTQERRDFYFFHSADRNLIILKGGCTGRCVFVPITLQGSKVNR